MSAQFNIINSSWNIEKGAIFHNNVTILADLSVNNIKGDNIVIGDVSSNVTILGNIVADISGISNFDSSVIDASINLIETSLDTLDISLNSIQEFDSSVIDSSINLIETRLDTLDISLNSIQEFDSSVIDASINLIETRLDNLDTSLNNKVSFYLLNDSNPTYNLDMTTDYVLIDVEDISANYELNITGTINDGKIFTFKSITAITDTRHVNLIFNHDIDNGLPSSLNAYTFVIEHGHQSLSVLFVNNNYYVINNYIPNYS